jgi:hypothetical protein
MKQIILFILLVISLGAGLVLTNRIDFLTPDDVTDANDSTVIRLTDDNKIGYIYQKGDSLYAKCKDSIFLLSSRLQMGEMRLTAPDTTHCTTAGTYYKIYSLGGFSDGENNNFTVDGNGKITFTGLKGTNCITTGVSDVTADKQCQLYYALYKNGSLVANAETPVDINNPGKAKSIAITRMIPHLKSGDYFEIYVKSDVANTIVTHNTLFITFIGDR